MEYAAARSRPERPTFILADASWAVEERKTFM